MVSATTAVDRKTTARNRALRILITYISKRYGSELVDYPDYNDGAQN
jgi:hypothetical protein